MHGAGACGAPAASNVMRGTADAGSAGCSQPACVSGPSYLPSNFGARFSKNEFTASM